MFNTSKQQQKHTANQRLSSSPRKKKRKCSSAEDQDNFLDLQNINGSSVVQFDRCLNSRFSNSSKTLHLIDRVLDFSKYDREASLYSLAREWLNSSSNLTLDQNKNSTKRTSSSNQNVESETSIKEQGLITCLPDAHTQIDDLSVKIGELNERIKQKVRNTEQNDLSLLETLSVDEFTKQKALLKLHVNRWKMCRKEWTNYYKQANDRHKNSYELLRSIYQEMV